jgi:hypothetical protein
VTAAGVLFARAIALVARAPGPLLVVFAVVWLPQIAIVLFTQHQVTAPVATSGTPLDTMRSFVAHQVAQVPYLAFMLLVAPLGNVAVIVTAFGYATGVPVAPPAALRRALGLWGPAVVVALLGATFTVLVLLSASIVLGLIAAAVLLVLGSANREVASAFAVATGVVGMLIGLGLMGFVWAALGMATVTLVFEEPRPLRAARLTLRRVLDRSTVRGTVRIGVVYVGVQFGAALLLDVVALPLASFANGALAATVAAIGGAVVTCVLLTFLLLYTLELRVDREGADLLAAVDALPDDADRELIEHFLARRDTLAPAARSAIAARIGERVRPKLRASFAHLDDEALLEHLARSTS